MTTILATRKRDTAVPRQRQVRHSPWRLSRQTVQRQFSGPDRGMTSGDHWCSVPGAPEELAGEGEEAKVNYWGKIQGFSCLMKKRVEKQAQTGDSVKGIAETHENSGKLIAMLLHNGRVMSSIEMSCRCVWNWKLTVSDIVLDTGLHCCRKHSILRVYKGILTFSHDILREYWLNIIRVACKENAVDQLEIWSFSSAKFPTSSILRVYWENTDLRPSQNR